MNELMMKDLLRLYYHECEGDEESKYHQFLKGNARMMSIYKEYTEILNEIGRAHV